MSTLVFAYATGGPPSPDLQIQLCVYAPALTIALSWFLMRWKRQLVWGALALAVIDAFVVILPFEEYLDSITWIYRGKPWSLVIAPWIATAMPFLAIWKLHIIGKKEPNQPLQRNASTGPVSNFESPARRG